MKIPRYNVNYDFTGFHTPDDELLYKSNDGDLIEVDDVVSVLKSIQLFDVDGMPVNVAEIFKNNAFKNS